MRCHKSNDSKSNFSLSARVLVKLPECLQTDSDSPFYEIYEQLAYFNQTAISAIKLEEEYYELTAQIKQIHTNLDQLSETSVRLALLKQILKLERQRKMLSIAWNRFKEHHRWAELVKKEQFWDYSAQRVISGEESVIAQLKQSYMRQAHYLDHDSYALKTAAQHSLYCQKLVNTAMLDFQQLSRPYTAEQRPKLMHYLVQCKSQLHQDHDQLCWAMVQRITLALENDRLGECDPIQFLLVRMQQIYVLNERATLAYGAQMNATTNTLAYFVQHVLRYGSAEQIQTIDRALQTHQHASFRLHGSIKNPILLPATLERRYSDMVDSKRSWSFVRKQCQVFMKNQQPLVSRLLFMPKIHLGEKIPATVDTDEFWKDLYELQELLAHTPRTFTWKQTLLRFFIRDFKRYAQQWKSYVADQQLKVLQMQVDVLENILSGDWSEARVKLIENPSQLQKFEMYLNACFQWVDRLDCMNLKSRQTHLFLLLEEVKVASEKRQTEKQAVIHIKEEFEQLLSYRVLLPQQYYLLQQQLLALNPRDRQSLQVDYFSEAGDFTLLLRHYFTETLLAQCSEEQSVLHSVVLQCLGLMQNLMIDTKKSYLDELFDHAIQAYKAAIVSGDIKPEEASGVKSQLLYYFSDVCYTRTIIELPIATTTTIIKDPNGKGVNSSVNSLFECVEKQLTASQQLLQISSRLLSSMPKKQPEAKSFVDCNPRKIADFLIQQLSCRTQANQSIPFVASEVSTHQLRSVG